MSKYNYIITVESYKDTYEELNHLYKQCYDELLEIYKKDGRIYSEYNPWLEAFNDYDASGCLILYVVKVDAIVVGYCLMYITQDMGNKELIACESGIYILPEHRNGLGKHLGKVIVKDMTLRGVKRIILSAINEHVVNLWTRIGFKPIATTMELML